MGEWTKWISGVIGNGSGGVNEVDWGRIVPDIDIAIEKLACAVSVEGGARKNFVSEMICSPDFRKLVLVSPFCQPAGQTAWRANNACNVSSFGLR